MEFEKNRFETFLLVTMLVFTFIRASNIGFGYPSLESQIGHASFLPQKILQALTFALLLVYVFLYPHRALLKRKISLVSYCIFFSIAISMIFSQYGLLSARYFLSFLVVFLPLFFFVQKFGSAKLIDFVYIYIAALTIVNFVYIIVFPQYGMMQGIHAGAFRGMFLHKNLFGFFNVIAGVFFLCAFKYSSGKIKLANLALYVLSLFMVFSAKSTTSLVLFMLSSLLFFSLHLFSYLRNINLRIIVYYLVIAVVLISANLGAIYFEEITYALGKEPTLTGRTGLWEVLFYIGMEKPIFGHGFGLFYRPEIMHEFASEFGWSAKSTHNSYLDIYLGIGVVGFSSVMLLLLKSLLKFPFYEGNSPAINVCFVNILIILCFGMSESGVFFGTDIVWVLLLASLFAVNSEDFKAKDSERVSEP